MWYTTDDLMWMDIGSVRLDDAIMPNHNRSWNGHVNLDSRE